MLQEIMHLISPYLNQITYIYNNSKIEDVKHVLGLNCKQKED